MPQLRVVFLWHMHQPFYKDLVTNEYRLPWVRLHGLKDYYGMVKLLEEFPQTHQTFNLVPSLVAQLQDYVAGTAQDPFFSVAAKPAQELSPEERRFALQYFFQANPVHMIARYPRYAELWEATNSPEKLEDAQRRFAPQDFTDLQVLSQIAWFDEFFLGEPEVAGLIQKGRNFSREDQQGVIELERQFLARIIPEYIAAAGRGSVEISTSPYYHPILPLLCDTSVGRASSPGLHLPSQRFRHPEDAREQLRRGLDLMEKTFGKRPVGAWPSEGSVSDTVFAIAHQLGLEWMATDEGVLGRSENSYFHRDGNGRLQGDGPDRLYRVYRYESGEHRLNMVFRDHMLSDLVGFAYSGMKAEDAAGHFIQSIKDSAQSLLDKGQDATVAIILDGENAWEHYPQSGREFLRRLYDGLNKSGIEALTVSEAIAREQNFGTLKSIVPGSWINANFNVWIGAPEDNISWDYLSAARDYYAERSPSAEPHQRELAFEEILIAEGSDWNWWYGPEHHSANDADFDELYRKHLANVYRALGGVPPDNLAQSIIAPVETRAFAVPQTTYIHPRIDGNDVRYFDWIGAATLAADTRDSAMHGKEFLLEKLHAGIDESKLYGRTDFHELGRGEVQVTIDVESWAPEAHEPHCRVKLDVRITNHALSEWNLIGAEQQSQNGYGSGEAAPGADVRLRKVLEFSVPLARLAARENGRLRLRASAFRGGLPLDSLPPQGWMELAVVSEEKLQELSYEAS